METINQIFAQLGIDSTFFYLFGLMFVLHIVLSTTYLKPFQKLLHDRREKTEGVKRDAQRLVNEAEAKFEQYREKIKGINDKARGALREHEELARKEEIKILSDAATKAKASLQSIQRDLETQRKAAVEALAGDISGIATDIATKVLGRPVSTK